MSNIPGRNGSTPAHLRNVGVEVDGLESMLARLTVMSMKLENPQPMLNDIVKEFQAMEAIRFKNSGMAPEFGINMQWQPIAEKTLEERGHDGLSGNRPLLAHGYLAKAATNPVVTFPGKKTVSFDIDPRRYSQEIPGYDQGVNYGVYHQIGQTPEEGIRGKREFVTFTPAFGKYVKMIIAAHLNGEITGNVPRYQEIGTRGGRGLRGRARKTWGMKEYNRRRNSGTEGFSQKTTNKKVGQLRDPESKISYGEFAYRTGYGDLLYHYNPQWFHANKYGAKHIDAGAVSRSKIIKKAQADYDAIKKTATKGVSSYEELARETGVDLRLIEFHRKEIQRFRDPENQMTKAGFGGIVRYQRDANTGEISSVNYGDWSYGSSVTEQPAWLREEF